MFDLKIKNAKIIDGCGNASFSGEIGVTDNTIIERGKKIGQAKHIFNAKGLTLCPGIIDAQTNYCSPITWDNALCSLFRLGTTTAIIGNCILGAMIPKNRKRKKNISKLTKEERIHYNFPKNVINSEFQNCTEYFKFLKKIKPFINICSVISHSDLRFWVMGRDATKRKATNKEISNMEKTLRDAMQNGIIGFASSNFNEHNGFTGIPFPSKLVSKEELKRLVKAMSKYARGVFITAKSNNLTINDIIDIVGNTKRPTVVSTLFHNLSKNDRASKTLDEIYLARKKGFEIWGSAYYKSGKIEFSMNDSFIFEGISTWNEFMKKKSLEEKYILLKDNNFRKRLNKEIQNKEDHNLFKGDWNNIKLIKTKKKKWKSKESFSVQSIAKEENKKPLDWLLDNIINNGLDDIFAIEPISISNTELRKLLKYKNTTVAISDIRSYPSPIDQASFGLDLLGKWVREEKLFSIEEAVQFLTSKQADIWRIPRRGRLLPGHYADMILIDESKIGYAGLIKRKSLYGEPLRSAPLSKGIHAMWINGRLLNPDLQVGSHGEVIRSFLT